MAPSSFCDTGLSRSVQAEATEVAANFERLPIVSTTRPRYDHHDNYGPERRVLEILRADDVDLLTGIGIGGA
jgi:hypothetical protein